MYFHTLQQCAETLALLAARGFRAEVVSGESDQERQIDAFRRGEVQVLVNCLMLGERFDCPELRTVFCRPSGRSVAVQACGRVLRKSAVVPIKNIVQCERTRWPFARTATPKAQFQWSAQGWRSLQANEQMDQISLRMLRALANTQVTLPKYLVKRQPKSRPAWRDRTTDPVV
jgi:superfamily II DNA or RNA helicase